MPHRCLVNRLVGTPVVAGMKSSWSTAALAATALSLAAAISLAQAGLTAKASPDVKQSDFSQLDGVALAGAGSAPRPPGRHAQPNCCAPFRALLVL